MTTQVGERIKAFFLDSLARLGEIMSGVPIEMTKDIKQEIGGGEVTEATRIKSKNYVL